MSCTERLRRLPALRGLSRDVRRGGGAWASEPWSMPPPRPRQPLSWLVCSGTSLCLLMCQLGCPGSLWINLLMKDDNILTSNFSQFTSCYDFGNVSDLSQKLLFCHISVPRRTFKTLHQLPRNLLYLTMLLSFRPPRLHCPCQVTCWELHPGPML